jgi:hypothetical protein
MLLAAIEPARPQPFLENGFWQGGELSCGQEAHHCSPGEKTFEHGKLAIHAAWLQSSIVHQEALVVPEISRGDVRRGQLVLIRFPEPGGEGCQVAPVVLDRERTALGPCEIASELQVCTGETFLLCQRYTASFSRDL